MVRHGKLEKSVTNQNGQYGLGFEGEHEILSLVLTRIKFYRISQNDMRQSVAISLAKKCKRWIDNACLTVIVHRRHAGHYLG